MFWKYLLYGFLIYIAWKFIFDLVIPVYRATQKVKKGFRDMHAHMQEQMKQQQSSSNYNEPVGPKASPGDYIDFEEVSE